MPPGFVITGTGRSGTNYIARVLRAAGVRCGHEDWWGPMPGLGEGSWIPQPTLTDRLRDLVSRTMVEVRRRRRSLDGDSSWLAVPHLEDFDGLVLLQLREPLRVIRSLVALEMFSAPRNAFELKARVFVPQTGDSLVDAMRWWVMWNLRASESADLVYRIEDLDAPLLRDILELIGADPARAEKALSSVPTRTNTLEERGRGRPDLSWADLPAGPQREALAETASAFGYSCSRYQS